MATAPKCVTPKCNTPALNVTLTLKSGGVAKCPFCAPCAANKFVLPAPAAGVAAAVPAAAPKP